ncbi:MAG: N-acetylmuramic acid 6-phosphate etherase [Chloroflexota bacterium]
MLTEGRNVRSAHIDSASTIDLLMIMNDEDALVAQVVRNALPNIALTVDMIVSHIQDGGRLIYVGAGTSGRLGVLDAVECVPTFGTPPELVIGIIAGGSTALTNAVEGAEDRTQDGRSDLEAVSLSKRDVVVGIAASGRTPYVLGAVAYANEIGAGTIGIACNDPSPLLEIAQIKIGLPVGPEVITGSTRLKSGTAQKMALNMLSTASMVKLGKVYDNLMVDVKVTNEKLADRAQRIVSEIAGVDYNEAGRLLRETANNVKTAIVVSKRHVTPEEAERLLANAEGQLHQVIDE